MSDRYAYILAMAGLGFTVLGVAVWRLHVLMEEAAGRIFALEQNLLMLVKSGTILVSPPIAEDPGVWGC